MVSSRALLALAAMTNFPAGSSGVDPPQAYRPDPPVANTGEWTESRAFNYARSQGLPLLVFEGVEARQIPGFVCVASQSTTKRVRLRWADGSTVCEIVMDISHDNAKYQSIWKGVKPDARSSRSSPAAPDCPDGRCPLR